MNEPEKIPVHPDHPAVSEPEWASTEAPAPQTEEMAAVPALASPAPAAAVPVAPVTAAPASTWSLKKTLAVVAAALGIATVGAAGGAAAVALTGNTGVGTHQDQGPFGPGSGQVDPDGDNWQGGRGDHHGGPHDGGQGGTFGGSGQDANGGSGQTSPGGQGPTAPDSSN